jgi:predicted RNA-binding Zn-ribbon protein involved in translation (DUF1610 family)
MKNKICIRCKKNLTNDPGAVEFKCPSCGEVIINRCSHCRQLAAEYKCPKCAFVGPN